MTEKNPVPHRAVGGFRLGSIAGFEVRIDMSWFVIFFLLFWSLSKVVFPAQFPALASPDHAVMGLTATLLFFASLLAHELSHALVSRAKSIPVEGITLFIFGGIARASREPDTPKDELLIAGVGPVTSLGLAAMFEVGARLAIATGLPVHVWGVARYLAFINLVLAVFNLMPGFPLDGGRVFRAAVWALTGDRTKATRWAATGGRWLGTALMLLGAIQALGGATLGGLWLVFIGWFLRGLAGVSLQQHMLRHWLRGYVAADLMSPQPEVVPAEIPLDVLVSERFMRLRFQSYPVMDERVLVGMVTLEDVRRVPKDLRAASTAADAMTPLAQCAVTSPEANVELLLDELSRPGAHGRALVVDRGRLVGIISASDLARWIQRIQAVERLVGESG